MIKIILSILLFVTISHANSERYFIKLGSFKNLNGLKKNINRLPYNLRSHIIIVRRNSWYVPFAYYTSNRNSLYRYVPKFRRYFHDAFISHSKHILDYPVVKNYTKQHILHKKKIVRQYPPYRREPAPIYRVEPSYQTISTPKVANYAETISIPTYREKKESIIKIESNQKNKYFTKNILSGKNFYLAYKSTKDSPNLLIKVTFQNHTVTYQPIIGDMQMTKANYLIENGRLYMFADSFTEDGAYSKLEKDMKNYFLVSSWTNGKKLNILRYYYNLNDAKEYLGIETSKGLANVLETGKYDDFFLEEDEDY